MQIHNNHCAHTNFTASHSNCIFHIAYTHRHAHTIEWNGFRGSAREIETVLDAMRRKDNFSLHEMI